MKRTYKRLFALVLALFLCFNIMTISALAEEPLTEENPKQPVFTPAVALEDESERLVGRPRFGGDNIILDEDVPLAAAPPEAAPNYGAIMFSAISMVDMVALAALLLLARKLCEPI